MQHYPSRNDSPIIEQFGITVMGKQQRRLQPKGIHKQKQQMLIERDAFEGGDRKRADISLRNTAIDVSADSSGGISIYGQNLSLFNTLLQGTTSTENGGIVLLNVVHKLVLDNSSNIITSTKGKGRGGDLRIETGELIIQNDSLLGTQTIATGDAGDLYINATDIGIQDNSEISSITKSNGKGGNMFVNAKNGSIIVKNNAILGTSAEGSGDAGDLAIFADTIDIKGNISRIGRLTTGIATATKGNGNAGDLFINARQIFVSVAAINSASEGSGDAGDLTINTESLLVKDGAQINSGTFGAGEGGNLTITAKDIQVIGTTLDEKFPTSLGAVSDPRLLRPASAEKAGKAGDVIINTNTLLVRDGGAILTSTLGNGLGGNLTISAENIKIIGTSPINNIPSTIASLSEFGSTSNAGDLTIITKGLVVHDGAQVATSTLGAGNGGNLTITATNIQVTGSKGKNASIIASQADKHSAKGVVAGDLKINADVLVVQDGGQISTGTFGAGNGGNLTILAKNIRVIGATSDGNNPSLIRSQTEPGSTGNAGDLIIQTDILDVINGGQISASTNGAGNAGNLSITAEEIQVIGRSSNGLVFSGLGTQASSLSTGNAGSLIINTNTLFVRDGAQIDAATFSSGVGGNLTIKASDIQLTGEAIISVESRGQGEAGDIFISTGKLFLDSSSISGTLGNKSIGDGNSVTINANEIIATNGGNITTNTAGSSTAGNITLSIKDNLSLSGTGSGIFSNTDAGSTGKGGSIFIDPTAVNISDGAAISVNSTGTGTGGNITLVAGTLTLNNGIISATTTSSDGGNITLNIKGLSYLTDNSQISASAGGFGTGGNLIFDTRFLIATQNSDISANAFQGQGGNINITSEGIFLSPDSTVTASSELGIDGTVQLNTLDVDPSRGLTELPENVVDAGSLISQQCGSAIAQSDDRQGEFIVTGRGGIPTNSRDPLTSDSPAPAWITVNPEPEGAKRYIIPKTAPKSVPKVIVEATGAQRDVNGAIVFTTNPSQPAPSSQLQVQGGCRAS